MYTIEIDLTCLSSIIQTPVFEVSFSNILCAKKICVDIDGIILSIIKWIEEKYNGIGLKRYEYEH